MRIGVLTGGGDCPGLNPAIRAIVYRGIDFADEIIGVPLGWKGMLEGEGKEINLKDVEEIINQGGTILGTSRTNPYKVEGGSEKVLESISKLKLDALIAIGGEDTLGVASRLYSDFKARVVGVPKTMDNDLSETDFTFGFDTASTISMEALERLRDTAKSHRRIMVLEVMGRHAGWVALYTALGGGADAVLLPEVPVNLEELSRSILKHHQRKGYGLVVVSEGIEITATEDSTQNEVDSFGHIILGKRAAGAYIAEELEKRTKLETRSVQIGHIQRGGPPTLFDRVLGTLLGIKAIDLIHEGKFGFMASYKDGKVTEVPLEMATKEIKKVSTTWLELLPALFKK